MGRLFKVYIDIKHAAERLLYSSGADENVSILYLNSWVDLRSIRYFCENLFGKKLPVHQLRYARDHNEVECAIVPRWNSSRGGERYLYRLESIYNWLNQKKFFEINGKTLKYSPDFFMTQAFLAGLPGRAPDFEKAVKDVD